MRLSNKRSFLDRLLQENAELRASQAQLKSPQARNVNCPWQGTSMDNEDDNTIHDNVLGESDWFTHTRSSDTPIWIGEISDAAFATRFRQFASAAQLPEHIPRTQFPPEDAIRNLAMITPTWPPPTHSNFLAETALDFLRENYHIVRRSEVLSALNSIPSGQRSLGLNSSNRAKIWALFAIGELRSSKCPNQADKTPGLAYFAMASETIRMINERPQLDVIEALLLLVSSMSIDLSITLHTLADGWYWLSLRLATIMGLHMNIGDTYVPDPGLREHRIRVWWSVYMLDRILSSKIGLPLSISDDDISVNLPSDVSALNSNDFADHFYFVAVLRLARIAGDISRSLYVRTPQPGTFLQRVAKIREALELWRKGLPEHLKLDPPQHNDNSSDPGPKTFTLQLAYNQLLILATRPVLLYVFRRHIERVATTSPSTCLPEQVEGTADSCVRAARQSSKMLFQSWVNGGFHIFDYSYVRYFFSSSVILAISSVLGKQYSQDDKDRFNLAAGFLQQLKQNGNPAAMEFYAHINEIRNTLDTRSLVDDYLNTLQTNEDGVSQLPGEAFSSSLDPQPVAQAISSSIDEVHGTHDSPLTLSFLDDWIYDNALQQLRWQEQ
ncbi:hypothetical protein FAUST_10767 [Fusarium austroamericanum]|uniref:Xylanolytic transcriptional activator regulatory domain-containing protein n=1 Tax=Fusarium austroamericanum TaxID=282268 RepID=A0AAN6BVE4_FUSAU|nr:hypothetical protein FAUST_10767 [Fusarium austroamericanum]